MQENQIQSIEEKLQSLLHRYQRLQKENSNLKAELHEATAALALAQKENEQLRQKLDVNNMGLHQLPPEEKKKLQTRIDHYLKEIERCMNLLNA